MKTFKELRENLIIEKVTHTTLSAVKSILPAGHVRTHEESNDDTKVKHNDIIVSRNAKHKEHARFRATSETGGGDITLASYTSREPEHVAIAAHEAHHALIHHKLKGQGALHSNEHIVNKMTRKWIDKNYVGNDRARAHAAIDKSEASYKDHLPGQVVKEAASTSYNKPDEHTDVMSYHDLEAHIGKPKALLIAKHEQFKKHMSPQMSLGAKVGFKFERRHGFEHVYAVHGPNKYVDKEKPGYRTMLRFHLSGSGKKVTQVDRSVNHNNERHREGSLVWDHRETWEHPVNKRENKRLAKSTK